MNDFLLIHHIQREEKSPAVNKATPLFEVLEVAPGCVQTVDMQTDFCDGRFPMETQTSLVHHCVLPALAVETALS